NRVVATDVVDYALGAGGDCHHSPPISFFNPESDFSLANRNLEAKEPSLPEQVHRKLRSLRATVRRFVKGACIVAASYCLALDVAFPQSGSTHSPAQVCLSANENLSLQMPLPRTAARLKFGTTLRVVAIGSSST